MVNCIYHIERIHTVYVLSGFTFSYVLNDFNTIPASWTALGSDAWVIDIMCHRTYRG